MSATSEQAKKPHAFKGTLTACLVCFYPKSDKRHQDNIDVSALESRVSPVAMLATPPKLQGHSHICVVCNCTLEHTNEDDILSCAIRNPYVCGKCINLSHSDREYASWAQNATNIGAPTSLCAGHQCVKCGNSWNHDYLCGKESKSAGLCVSCASQSTVNIFRPVEIEQIAQTSSDVLTGREHAELRLQNENICWLMCHDPVSRKLLPDWQEKLHAHRYNQKQLIERHRIGEISTAKCTLDFQNEETNSLTPEEREQYERDAARRKKSKATTSSNGKSPAANQQDSKEVAKAALSKLYADLCKQVRTKRPNLTEDEILIAAKRRLEMMKSDEGDN